MDMLTTTVTTNKLESNAYQNYLQRPVLEDFINEFDGQRLRVEAAYTVFVNQSRDEEVNVNSLLDQIKAIRQLAKQGHTKLQGINKLTRFLKDHQSEYQMEVADAQTVFQLLVDGWRGYTIHEGYGDDNYYNEYLEPLKFKLQKMHYQNTLLSKYQAAAVKIKRAQLNLSDQNVHFTVIGF